MFYLFFLCVALIYFVNLGLNTVWIPNESFYADASRRMLESKDFLTPVYNGELRLNKPPMTYWLTALSFALFGINEFALRFFQAVLGLGTGVIAYLLGRRLCDEKTGILSFLALSLSLQFVANARYTSPEIPFVFFITLTLYLWFRGYEEKRNVFIYLSFLSASAAVLTKGPAGYVLPAMVVIIYLLITDWREVFKPKYYIGTAFVFLASGWWFIYQYLENREAFLEVFIKENVKRIYALQRDPFYYYLLDINISFLPYSFLVFAALIWAVRRKRRELLFPLVWFLSILSLFSLVKMKIPVYILPAFPAMALLVSTFLLSEDWKRFKYASSIILGFLLFTTTAFGGYLFKLNILLLIIIFLSLIATLLSRHFIYAPLVGGAGLLIYLSIVFLPEVEKFRPYRKLGEMLYSLREKGAVYEVGHFHHNLPFYSRGKVIRNVELEEVKKPAVVLIKEPASCESLWRGKLYIGSESRFFVFLRDIKRGRRFEWFRVCLNPIGEIQTHP